MGNMTKLKYNPYVAAQEKVSYAKEEEENFQLDCGDGCSPYGCSERVMQALREVQVQDVATYPHGFALKDAIINRWKEFAPLQYDQIYLNNSGMDAIACINTMFSYPGAVVVGLCPQFTDYVLSARCHGFTYRPVYLQPEEDYRIVPQRVVDAIDDAVSLVYLDNPNNPTGQNITPVDLRTILKRASDVGACVVVDEAYGDYLAQADSALTMLKEFDNLLVIRSFSKGSGLAGMRAGYSVASKEIIAQMDKVSNPYCISGVGRRLAIAAMDDMDFIAENRQRLIAAKQMLRSCTGHILHMAATLDSCSICLLTHSDPDCDLAKIFAAHGVKVVAGSDFEGLSPNAVRLRLPSQEQEALLMEIVRKIDMGE